MKLNIISADVAYEMGFREIKAKRWHSLFKSEAEALDFLEVQMRSHLPDSVREQIRIKVEVELMIG